MEGVGGGGSEDEGLGITSFRGEEEELCRGIPRGGEPMSGFVCGEEAAGEVLRQGLHRSRRRHRHHRQQQQQLQGGFRHGSSTHLRNLSSVF